VQRVFSHCQYLLYISYKTTFQGRIQEFKLGGGGHFKKLCRAEGSAKIFGDAGADPEEGAPGARPP
jgi:hypothetical protein